MSGIDKSDGNRVSKTVTTGGAFPTTTKVIDVYQTGRVAYETDGANTTLATFTYSPDGTPTSVTVGSHPSTDPRYYYVYNPHGDVVALVDGGGTTVATYSYDAYGTPTIWESFTNGWHNPYLYDGVDQVRYDSETSLYWMSVRAYDPALGRFISHDPLGRAPLFFDASQPYAYAANNPLRNTDPSGQLPGGAFVDGGHFWYPSSAWRVTANPPELDKTCDAFCVGTIAQAKFLRIAQAILAAVGIVADLVNAAYSAIKLYQDINGEDFKKLASPIDRVLSIGDDLLGLASGVVGFISDVVSFVGAFVGDTSGIMQFVYGLNSILDFFTAGYKAFKSAVKGWGMVGWALMGGIEDIEKVAAGTAKFTIWGALSAVLSVLGALFNRDLLKDAATALIQGVKDVASAYIAHVESLSPLEFCTDWSTAPYYSWCAG